jgi:hypothetical protein
LGGWDTAVVEEESSSTTDGKNTILSKSIQESNDDIQRAEEQLEKDLAELAAIMAEHTDDSPAEIIKEKEEKEKAGNHIAGTATGSMDDGDDGETSEDTFSDDESDDEFVF